MPINLEEHKIFIKDLNMEVVPYSVVLKAMEELEVSLTEFQNNQFDIQEEMKKITDAFKEINEAFKDIDRDLPLENFND